MFNEGPRVEIKTEVAKSDWLGFPNILQLNTRSFIDKDRRMKFSNAVLTSNYNEICLWETWLNEKIISKELPLNDIDIYQKDRELDGDKNVDGGSLIAVKNSLVAEQITTPFWFMRSLQNETKHIGSSFLGILQPPISSAYRYFVENFQNFLKSVPKSKPAIICGDLNFPKTNRNTNSSSSEEENSIL